MIILSYFLITIALTFSSWLVGLILNGAIKNKAFYSKITHLNFIKKESVNRSIGIDGFKWVIKNSFFKYFNQKLKFKTRPSISQLKEIRKEMTYSEISHFVGFIFILVIIVLKLLKGQNAYAFMLFIFNIIFNLYPSSLQQQNKKRMDRILKR